MAATNVGQGYLKRQTGGHLKRRIMALTADKTLTFRHLDNHITNRGAAADINVTLPSAVYCKGRGFSFDVVAAGYAITFTGASSQLLVYGTTTAATMKFFRIGDGGTLISDGTSWLLIGTTPPAPLGFRVSLDWKAGQRGKPGINADINSATEATREVADPDFELLGTNAVSSCSTFNVEGGIKLTTTTADGDEVILVGHLDSNQSAWGTWTWGTDRSVEWECDIATDSSIAKIIIWAGLKLTNTEVVATDADQVYFRFEDDVSSGVWKVISSIGGTDTETASSVTVAASTRYHLKITIDSSRIARCYINGALIYTTAALTSVDLIPYIGVAADGATPGAKAITVYGQRISRLALAA